MTTTTCPEPPAPQRPAPQLPASALPANQAPTSLAPTGPKTTAPDSLRDAAMAEVARFCARSLLPTVWRIATWKGLPLANVPDLMADVAQELAVDGLEQPQVVMQLSEPARHRRWMRLAERWIYHERIAPMRRTDTDPYAIDHLVAPAHQGSGLLGPIPASACVRLRNGRLNVREAAQRIGVTHRELGRRCERWADQLDHGERYVRFWRARAAEALTGLAADLLRLRGVVHELRPQRQRPNPAGRLRRLRRIARNFTVRPATAEVRRTLRRWLRRGNPEAPRARPLLESAVALVPYATSAWMWLFEACLADGDLRAAATAVRSACRLAAPSRRARTLARARLLEARGKLSAAVALLQRASRRWPNDGALVAIVRRLEG